MIKVKQSPPGILDRIRRVAPSRKADERRVYFHDLSCDNLPGAVANLPVPRRVISGCNQNDIKALAERECPQCCFGR